MAKKETKFAQESAVESIGPSKAMLALFQPPTGGLDLTKAIRVNLPQMIKPKLFKNDPEGGDFTLGAVLAGEILKIVDSPASVTRDIKGKCLWLKIVGTEEERLLPAVGTIRHALAPGIKRNEYDKIQVALEKHIGEIFAFKRLEDQYNKEFGKDQYMFEVFLLSK